MNYCRTSTCTVLFTLVVYNAFISFIDTFIDFGMFVNVSVERLWLLRNTNIEFLAQIHAIFNEFTRYSN